MTVVSKFIPTQWKTDFIARIALSIMLVSTGISHFTNSKEFIAMIPPILPNPELINFASGVAELLLSIGLLTRYYAFAGVLATLFFVMIFPANINNALSGNEVPGGLNQIPYYPWVRLFFQPFYIWWALWSTNQLPRHGRARSMKRAYDSTTVR